MTYGLVSLSRRYCKGMYFCWPYMCDGCLAIESGITFIVKICCTNYKYCAIIAEYEYFHVYKSTKNR